MAKGIKDFVAEARARIREISPDELKEWRARDPGLLIVDVREPAEYARSHLPGALLVPRGLLEAAADPQYGQHVEPLCRAQKRPVVVYCQTGVRSAMAVDTLAQMGFENVVNLAGGLVLWAAEDYPLERYPIS